MKFYTFDQNNSGGYFANSYGIGPCVVIQAETADHANKLAEEIGIYFNGCDEDVDGESIDCLCCGDRWCEVEESEIEERNFEFNEGMWVHFCNDIILGPLCSIKVKALNKSFDFPIRERV